MSVFRAYDIRGIVDQTLTEDLVYHIGRALGLEAAALGQDSVVVGRDGRLSGPRLLAQLTRGLRDAGRHVIHVGMVPTPVLYFATYHWHTGSGVQITGSHNPPQYNGLKIMLAGRTLFGEDIQQLQRRIADQETQTPPAAQLGTYEERDIRDAYLQRILGDVRLQRPLTVVVDCGNGAAGELAPRLLAQLGANVIPLFCEVDGHFPNHHPDPSKPENLRDLIAAVQAHGADLGLAFDGDGDRLGVVTPDGTIIWPDRQMMLYARDILARHPGGTILYDVKCTRHLATEIQAAGGQPLMWKTGHSFMKSKLKESGALLAGEMSGHIFFQERWYGFDDALYTAARLLEILSAQPLAPQEVFATLPNAVSTPELNLMVEEGRPFTLMAELQRKAQFSDAIIHTVDGLRVEYPDAWGLVRASNTTPCLVLRFEGDTPQALERIQTQFRQQLLAIDSGLTLPF